MKLTYFVTEQELLDRAHNAYFRNGGREQPSNSSEVTEHNDQCYVALRNVRGLLKLYRLRKDGKLTARIPEAIIEQFA